MFVPMTTTTTTTTTSKPFLPTVMIPHAPSTMTQSLPPSMVIQPKLPFPILSSPQQIPTCDFPFSCPIMINTKHPEHKIHTAQFKHVCFYGEDCRSKNDPAHMASFIHLKNPPCPKGHSCNMLCDAKHRATFHHSGLWDWLIPCMYGPTCKDKDKPEHCSKYQHNIPSILPAL